MTPHFMTRESFVSCPYMRIKKYSPAQYGQIEDIRWVSLGGCGLMDEDKRKPVFGGDVFISRFSLKRKMPMFYLTQFGQGDMIPFPYYDYREHRIFPVISLITIPGRIILTRPIRIPDRYTLSLAGRALMRWFARPEICILAVVSSYTSMVYLSSSWSLRSIAISV